MSRRQKSTDTELLAKLRTLDVAGGPLEFVVHGASFTGLDGVERLFSQLREFDNQSSPTFCVALTGFVHRLGSEQSDALTERLAQRLAEFYKTGNDGRRLLLNEAIRFEIATGLWSLGLALYFHGRVEELGRGHPLSTLLHGIVDERLMVSSFGFGSHLVVGGSNRGYVLGTGDERPYDLHRVPAFSTPAQTILPIALAMGNAHTVVLGSDRRLYGCGSNMHGQLGTRQSDYFPKFEKLEFPQSAEFCRRKTAFGVSACGDYTCIWDTTSVALIGTLRRSADPRKQPQQHHLLCYAERDVRGVILADDHVIVYTSSDAMIYDFTDEGAAIQRILTNVDGGMEDRFRLSLAEDCAHTDSLLAPHLHQVYSLPAPRRTLSVKIGDHPVKFGFALDVDYGFLDCFLMLESGPIESCPVDMQHVHIQFFVDGAAPLGFAPIFTDIAISRHDVVQVDSTRERQALAGVEVLALAVVGQYPQLYRGHFELFRAKEIPEERNEDLWRKGRRKGGHGETQSVPDHLRRFCLAVHMTPIPGTAFARLMAATPDLSNFAVLIDGYRKHVHVPKDCDFGALGCVPFQVTGYDNNNDGEKLDDNEDDDAAPLDCFIRDEHGHRHRCNREVLDRETPYFSAAANFYSSDEIELRLEGYTTLTVQNFLNTAAKRAKIARIGFLELLDVLTLADELCADRLVAAIVVHLMLKYGWTHSSQLSNRLDQLGSARRALVEVLANNVPFLLAAGFTRHSSLSLLDDVVSCAANLRHVDGSFALAAVLPICAPHWMCQRYTSWSQATTSQRSRVCGPISRYGSILPEPVDGIVTLAACEHLATQYDHDRSSSNDNGGGEKLENPGRVVEISLPSMRRTLHPPFLRHLLVYRLDRLPGGGPLEDSAWRPTAIHANGTAIPGASLETHLLIWIHRDSQMAIEQWCDRYEEDHAQPSTDCLFESRQDVDNFYEHVLQPMYSKAFATVEDRTLAQQSERKRTPSVKSIESTTHRSESDHQVSRSKIKEVVDEHLPPRLPKSPNEVQVEAPKLVTTAAEQSPSHHQENRPPKSFSEILAEQEAHEARVGKSSHSARSAAAAATTTTPRARRTTWHRLDGSDAKQQQTPPKTWKPLGSEPLNSSSSPVSIPAGHSRRTSGTPQAKSLNEIMAEERYLELNPAGPPKSRIRDVETEERAAEEVGRLYAQQYGPSVTLAYEFLDE